ncbi:cbb3-type cytochrome oxidase assembly protein CcoS [Aquisalimonas asiatica]|uniref:Cytochrome oxidase maturation protein, cbb3-type n=1 Tax=Aquisalimonas asiatica TaxID=406100 RepID=A0A1H8PWK9_9GAMM|nr:cbb3-type cytochrome oxidase assembly protein CcoS [Aquisalimonas asiatica]SEO46151.1 cytochrome oxidase maturation protein, cbb3-type [Aquisalimonas asiatica]
MNIIFVSIPISLILLGIGVAIFFWAVRNGQFDDLDTPAYSILMDEEEKPRQSRQRSTDGSGAEDDASDTHDTTGRKDRDGS